MSPISHPDAGTGKPNSRNLLYIAIVSLAGILVMLFGTDLGIAISPDSTAYLAAARGLLAGQGLSLPTGTGGTIPMTHFPPLLSMLLSASGVFGIELLAGARWLYALLFGGNIALAGLMIHRFTDGSPWAPLLGSLFMLSSVAMLDVHSMLLSEPPFIFFCLLGLWLLAEHLRDPKAWLLVAASATLALAFLTRYLGAALVATGFVGILALGKKNVRARVLDAALLAVMSCTPMGLWIARNTRLAGSAANRDLVFHMVSLRRLGIVFATLAEWVLPARVHAALWNFVFSLPGIVQAVLAASLLLLGGAALAFAGVMFWRKRKHYVAETFWIGPLSMFGVFYIVFLTVSISLFDMSTPLNSRILSPLFAVGLILLLCLAQRSLVLWRGRQLIRTALMVLVFIFAGSYGFRSIDWAVRNHNDGQAYTSRQWQQSELIELVKALPPATVIYSNGADAIYALTGREAAYVPYQVDPTSNRPNDNYTHELAEMRSRLKNQVAVMVHFDTITWRWYLPSESELREQLPLSVLSRGNDGTIYAIEPD